MAINTQKLLPQSQGISSALANFSGVSSGLSIQKKTANINKMSQLTVRYNEQNVDIVRRSLIDVDTLLKSVLTEDKNTTESKRRRKEREEFEERESRLEVPKEQRKFRLPQVSLPGMSFLDKVKRFLLFTGIGWLFTNFQDQLPKLVGIVKIITPLYGVVENVFKFILSSVVNFIERGYETYDKIRALVKSVGGEGAQQSFDALSSKLNEYINYILIGGMALTGAISAFATNVSKFKPQTQQPTGRPAATGGRPKVTTGAGGTSIKSGAARVTTSGGKLAERNIAKNILRRTVKPVLSKLPIVGALVEFGLSWALGDPVGKAAFRGIGSLLVGAVGTAIGGPIGAAIGGIVGGEVGGRLYDTFFGGKKPAAYRNGGRVIRTYAKGGGVLGDYGLGRTLEVERSRKPSPPPQSTQPGRDVGGKNEIKKLFPNPNENRLTYGKPNPYYALENTASDFKSAPYGLGSLMGGAIDVALGQKLSNNAILNASVGLENMFYDNYDRDKNFIDVRSIIFGVIKSAADSALNNIRNELSKGKRKKEEEKEKEKPTAPPAGGGGTDGGGGGGAAPGPAGGSIIATGLNDYKGRSIRLKGLAADAFIDMANEAKGQGIDLGPAISSSYRSLEDQIRVYKDKYGANWRKNMVWSSKHMDGTAFDINWDSKGGVWIRNNAPRFGFIYNSYSGESTHFEWSGNYTPKSKIAAQQYAKTPPTVTKPSTKTGTPPGPVPKGGTLNFDQLYNVARQAGFSEKNAKVAAAVALAESSGNSSNLNDNYKRGGGDNSYGLWQINMIDRPGYMLGEERRKKFGLSSNEQLFDPLTNAKIAYQLSGGSNFSAWTTYRDGKHLKYLPKSKKGGDVSRISSSNNYIPKQPSKYNTKSIETYPDYVDGGSRTRIAIQRIIIQKTVPVPMGGKSRTDFMIAGGGGVNNNMSSHRG